MAVEEDRAAQGEDDLLPLVADVDVGSAGDELLDLALAPGDGRQFELVGVRMLLDAEDLGDEDLVAIPDGAALFGLDAHAVGDRQAEDARGRDFEAGERQALDELRGRQVMSMYSRSQARGIFMGVFGSPSLRRKRQPGCRAWGIFITEVIHVVLRRLRPSMRLCLQM